MCYCSYCHFDVVLLLQKLQESKSQVQHLIKMEKYLVMQDLTSKSNAMLMGKLTLPIY